MIMIQRREREQNGPTQFVPGDLVHHRRYGYRGVVVEADQTCQASEAWYQNNQRQPDRKQPWYHVLVDQSAHVTYAAEENLELDDELTEILHPLTEHFFYGFLAGAYQRNDRPWGSTT